MPSTTDWIAAVSLGVTAATYIATKVIEVRERRWKLKTDAYLQFLAGNSIMLEGLVDRTSDRFRDGMIQIMESKHKILVYGDDGVVKALTNYFEGDGEWSDQNIRRYAALLNAMRLDNGEGKLTEYQVERTIIRPLPHKTGNQK